MVTTLITFLNSVFQVLDSEYVVSLLDVFPQGLGFVLVFEYMLSDLGEIIANDANAAIASITCCATKRRNKGNDIMDNLNYSRANIWNWDMNMIR